jgi:hypothetical protein
LVRRSCDPCHRGFEPSPGTDHTPARRLTNETAELLHAADTAVGATYAVKAKGEDLAHVTPPS